MGIRVSKDDSDRPDRRFGAGPASAAAQALRADLVGGMIAAHDLAAGPTAAAVQEQLERTLNEAGVLRIPVLTGERFDADRHSVAGTERTIDPTLIRTVVREVRPGWQTQERIIRPADVVVWTR